MLAIIFIPFYGYYIFWFGVLDKSSHSSFGLCAGMIIGESCVLVSFHSSSIRVFSMMICGNI
jgi:hypothetical protein